MDNTIGAASKLPTATDIATHIKLLHAIQKLRNQISTNSDLYDLDDEDIPDNINNEIKNAMKGKMAEKRWAVYVARAAYRFEKWWKVLHSRVGQRPLVIEDCQENGPMRRSIIEVPSQDLMSQTLRNVEDLPPLDVLLVWHAFILNSHDYFEDCLRGGMMILWHRGMPWSLIDAAIDSKNWIYHPGDGARKTFEAKTQLRWDNLKDPLEVDVICPSCQRDGRQTFVKVPWTTSGSSIRSRLSAASASQNPTKIAEIFTAGEGFADKDFSATCSACSALSGSVSLNHQKLRIQKFLLDTREHARIADEGYDKEKLSRCPTLPGTILSKTGFPMENNPLQGVEGSHNHCVAMMLIKRYFKSPEPFEVESFDKVRTNLEKCFKQAVKEYSRKLELDEFVPLVEETNMFLNRFISHYWNNSSHTFGIDLVGAAIRQGSFIHRLASIGWHELHSLANTSKLQSFITKYERCFHMLAQSPELPPAPTLDINLAWYTHQLSPPSYFHYSLQQTGNSFIFINPSAKISEIILSEAFEHTSKEYEKLYGEPYSQCACWHCEATRVAPYSSSISRLFKKDKKKIGSQGTYFADAATSNDPYKHPHLFAHNVVRPVFSGTIMQDYNVALDRRHNVLDVQLKQAQKRASGGDRLKSVPARPEAQDKSPGMGYARLSGIDYLVAISPYPHLRDPGITAGAYAADPCCGTLSYIQYEPPTDWRNVGNALQITAGMVGGVVALGGLGA